MRTSVASLRRQIAKARRGLLRPLCMVLEPHDGESEASWQARLSEAKRKAAAAEAEGRRAFVLIVDMDEEWAT